MKARTSTILSQDQDDEPMRAIIRSSYTYHYTMLYIDYTAMQHQQNRSDNYYWSMQQLLQKISVVMLWIYCKRMTTNIITRIEYSANSFFSFLYKMFNQLKNVIVDKISLVTKSENPAVPKASTKFALFKTAGNDLWDDRISDNQRMIDWIVEKLEKSIKIDNSIQKLLDMTLQKKS